jgi:hypothetical protein
MSTLPAKQNPVSPAMESIEQKFQRLAALWRTETAYVSSSTDLVSHPAFRAMVDMGPVIIPMVLRELERRSGHWHRVLRRIAGVDPVEPADRGNIERAAEAWLQWGRDQGYEW